jgi:hypothetical protein
MSSETFSIADFPAVTRVGAPSKYKEHEADAKALLSNAKLRTTSGLRWKLAGANNEEIAAESGKIASALRRVGKECGRKVTMTVANGHLYLKDSGEYVPLTPEQVQARANAKAARNAADQAQGAA